MNNREQFRQDCEAVTSAALLILGVTLVALGLYSLSVGFLQ
jgi:hypothetical protein